MKVEGRDDSYAETLARVAAILRSDEQERARIESMSKDSIREYLEDVVVDIGRMLGLAAATVAALIVDLAAIFGNAVTEMKRTFNEAYQSKRRIHRDKG